MWLKYELLQERFRFCSKIAGNKKLTTTSKKLRHKILTVGYY